MNPENYLNHLYWGQCQSPINSIFNSQLINAGLAAQMGSPVSFSDIPVGSPLGPGFQSTFSPYSPNNDFNLPETHQVRNGGKTLGCIFDQQFSTFLENCVPSDSILKVF